MKFRPLCQPSVSPEKRITAERERNRRVLEKTIYPPNKIRLTNATADQEAPWVLFTPPAREDGEEHRRHPSKIGERLIFLHEWGAGSV